MKKLLVVCISVIALFSIGLNYPVYLNSYSGETLGNAALAGVAGCAASEAWKGMTSPTPAPTQPRTQPTRDEVAGSVTEECFKLCDRRFPLAKDDSNFLRCLEACK